MLQIHHRLIIRHPSQPAILVVSDAGGLRLPAFASDDRHTAEVDYINLAVRERFGLLTTVLRSRRHSDPLGEVVVRIHELEAHGDGAPLSPGMHWCGRDELSSRAGGEDAEVIAEWLAAGVTPRVAVDGREWTLPGWFEEVCGWLERALADAGVREVHEIVQLRAWTSSCVLFVRTGAGDFYFKAVPESIRRECFVTAYLAQHFPDAIARIVARPASTLCSVQIPVKSGDSIVSTATFGGMSLGIEGAHVTSRHCAPKWTPIRRAFSGPDRLRVPT